LAVALSGLIKDQGLSVKTWQQMAPNLVRSVQLFDTMMYIFFAIIFITVIFSIANTLIMAIMERFHEIGVMKSVGTPPFLVGAMVIGEALALGLVGLCIGAV
jgi:putative ABC transport system permease protein